MGRGGESQLDVTRERRWGLLLREVGLVKVERDGLGWVKSWGCSVSEKTVGRYQREEGKELLLGKW